jgi:FkbM family methyltransferase
MSGDRPGLATAHKIRIAAVLYRTVSALRAIGGAASDIVVCRRRGLTWQLDLSEGIDLSIYLFGRFERPVQRLIERYVKPGMIALDIGANVGAHALPMTVQVGPAGRVLAVEPTRWAYDRLVENRRLNPGLEAALTPVHASLGRPGSQPAEFYASWNLKEQSNVHQRHRGALRPADGAAPLTLDGFVADMKLERLDFIKLDVDGAECDVLAGGRDTLARLRPMILFEFSPHVLEERGCDASTLLGLLTEHGYSFQDERGGTSLEPSALVRRTPRYGSINVMAVPQA